MGQLPSPRLCILTRHLISYMFSKISVINRFYSPYAEQVPTEQPYGLKSDIGTYQAFIVVNVGYYGE